MIRCILLLIACALSATALANDAGSGVGVEKIVTGNTGFACDLYSKLADKPGNLFFSPYSISTALVMTETGAAGDSAQQMRDVLKIGGADDKVARAFAALSSKLTAAQGQDRFTLRIANRLWGQKGFHFKAPFLKTLKQDFGAELGLVDFEHNADGATDEINAWVQKQTQDKIKDLIAKGVLDAQSRLVLTNAIYFKARWQETFEKGATQDGDFHVTGDKTTKARLMHQSEHFSYAEDGDTQVLMLPYDGAADMLVLLPKSADGLQKLEKQLSADSVAKWSKAVGRRKVNVTLPKFSVTQQFQLGDILQAMGMKLAFSNQADFSGMSSEEPLKISAVIHKAFVDVDENGTEAAAATAVAIALAAEVVEPQPPIEFKADHPFVFLIRDSQTGSILFLGRLVNPNAT